MTDPKCFREVTLPSAFHHQTSLLRHPDLILYALLVSGTCILLPPLLPDLPGKATFLVSGFRVLLYMFPWLLMLALDPAKTLFSRDHRPEIVLICLLMPLALINSLFGDFSRKSLLHMILFFSTGPFAAWTAMMLFTDQRKLRDFDMFCAIWCAVVVTVEVALYILTGNTDPRTIGDGRDPRNIGFFTGNPIPTGTLVILLSSGPIGLLASGVKRLWIAGAVLLASALGLILMTQRRGAFLAVIIMVIAWIGFKRPKWVIVPILVFAALALFVPLSQEELHRQPLINKTAENPTITARLLEIIRVRQIPLFRKLDPNIPSQLAVLHRLELYPFAAHVFCHHPLFGIGLRTQSHDQYLEDYSQRNPDLAGFRHEVSRLQTFDNMFLTFLVECGSLFSLVYFAFVGLIVYGFCRSCGRDSSFDLSRLYRVLPLLGFAVHSMFYDSLLFPAISWLFHVQLGILAAIPEDRHTDVTALPEG